MAYKTREDIKTSKGKTIPQGTKIIMASKWCGHADPFCLARPQGSPKGQDLIHVNKSQLTKA